MTDSVKLIRSKEVAEILEVSPSMLSRWRNAKKGPPFINLEGNPRYLLCDVLAYVEQQTVGQVGRD